MQQPARFTFPTETRAVLAAAMATRSSVLRVTGAGDTSVVSGDGTRIALWRSGSGRPLVAVHGTTADHTRWATVLPALESHFTVYAMDRRGRGGSGDAEHYAIEREFEDVAAAVDGIGEPVILLGHSFGGLCSLEASLRTANVQRLILYEPPIPIGIEIYTPGLIDRLQALLDAGDREALLTTFMSEVVRVPPDQLEFLRSLPAWEARLAAAHTLVRETRVDEKYRFQPERWRGFDTPTLLLLGGESPPFLTQATEALHTALPHSKLRVMPEQQHAAMDTAPDLFVEEILRFAGEQ
jgi:pimeloyl-ACP methyl ester carboxylesterase